MPRNVGTGNPPPLPVPKKKKKNIKRILTTKGTENRSIDSYYTSFSFILSLAISQPYTCSTHTNHYCSSHQEKEHSTCFSPPSPKNMACSATSTTLISSIAAAATTTKSMAFPISKNITLPNSFFGTRKSFQSRAPRSISLTRGSHSRSTFVVKASVSFFSDSLVFMTQIPISLTI